MAASRQQQIDVDRIKQYGGAEQVLRAVKVMTSRRKHTAASTLPGAAACGEEDVVRGDSNGVR